MLLTSILVAWPTVGAASPQVTLPDPVYKVHIEARYDPDTQDIQGVERLRWLNTASVAIDALEFHLYLNAFANNRSTFMTESGGQLRGITMDELRWGFIDVDAMHLTYGTTSKDEFHAPLGGLKDAPSGERSDLKTVEQIIQPDDGNPFDRTVARYPLPTPLQPGQWVELDISFTGRMPEVFARTGAEGDFVLGGQWFPKIGVFEDKGDRGRVEPGWNVHQFHGSSEFYADFGDWTVELNLPVAYAGKVGGTGRLVKETVNGDRVVVRFEQPGVHDFAWTADLDYLVIEDRFDPTIDVPQEMIAQQAELLGLSPDALALQPVDIRLLLQPAHRSQAGRYIKAVKAALRGYGLRLGAYPWPTMTLVDPPRNARGAGGMEYPTFITLGTHPALDLPVLDGLLAPELVTVHELGHNFFQGMIANNEFEEAWIDEGINSYYEILVMEETYGMSIEMPGLRLSQEDIHALALRNGDYSDTIAQPAWSYRDGRRYGFNSYPRPAMTLRHLENFLGQKRFHTAMRSFFQTWRFRHPNTADFEQAVQQSTKEDLAWFFTQALHSDRALDYGVQLARSRKHKEEHGWFWTDDGTREERGTKPEDEDEASEDEDEDTPYRTEVVIERKGEFIHPVDIVLTYEDGEKTVHQWDGRDRWVRYTDIRPSKLALVEIDPERRLVLDVDPLNNTWRLEPEHGPAVKILVNFLFWLQSLLELTTVLG